MEEVHGSANMPALGAYGDVPLDMILDSNGDVDFSLFDVDLLSLDASENTTDSSSTTPNSPHSGGDPSSPKPHTECSPPPNHPVRRRTPHSQRVKAERAFLSKQITELERQLVALMAKRAVAQASAPSVAWRDVAKRQFRRRGRAEEENARLKAKLIHQLQVAKSLERVFLNRSSEFFEENTAPRPGRYTSLNDGDIGTVFSQFMVDIHQAYGVVDAVLPGPEADELVPMDERPTCRSTIKAHSTNGVEKLYVEMRHSFVMPFAFDRMCEFTWRAVKSEFFNQYREMCQLMCTDDVYACQILVVDDDLWNAPREDFLILMFRQFVQADRLVIVWRGLTYAKGSSLRDANAASTGWLVVRPLKGMNDHVVMHLCHRGVPLTTDIVPTPLLVHRAQPPKAGEFTNRMICSAFDDVATLADSLESMLLEDPISSNTSAESK